MTVLDWLLDSDPSIRWQTLRDLSDAPPDVVAAERARVTNEGWGARLLALEGDDGLWEGGALFPVRNGRPFPGDGPGQPWTATAYSLELLKDLGADPGDPRLRRAVDLVRANGRWEHEGQPFWEGEVEPCINGMVVALGAYYGVDVGGVVDRLVGEQLEHTHPGDVHFALEDGDGRPSRWNTLRALRVLRWVER